ncbi:hypothetical protein SARC_06513 [Sphaeroforma arctica JP610]|uniref:Folylpolyglutamate synthase n=1 Tax=Sphaeroforma arctica JP610 TaxID=667725 RepID=A0A0L0FX80_9EUKA|nr:hypothetical protein SARC_06513 [Sphaeroforma arctica JP610]KNC81146.1 hypothetical protein SARC_06513 [Sphaeroforma arctica JP610]|eukprot:XP_014155048.1 hypothetical protein SARC_06513 [Sphaeroforma arctica JP610]
MIHILRLSSYNRLTTTVLPKMQPITHKTTARMEAGDNYYSEAILKLNSLQTNAKNVKMLQANPRANDKSLPEMRTFFERLGHKVEVLNSLNAIHISGSKGKGSTCAFSESILRCNGYRTGLYTSPHLVEVRERVRIDGKPLSKQAFTDRFNECWTMLQANKTDELQMPSYFRFMTLLAFHTFLIEKVDVSIIEVGIGGMYDPTNIIEKPVVCAVSSLGIDHVRMLGDTLPEIALHKAGIFKPHVPAFTTAQPAEALAVLVDYANRQKALLTLAPTLEAYPTAEPIQLGLSGKFQSCNAALALQATNQWRRWRETGSVPEYIPIDSLSTSDPVPLSPETITGLRACVWPGRAMVLERPEQNSTYYLDGAHTVESIQCAAEWMGTVLETDDHRSRRVLVFNCMDRIVSDLLAPLLALHKDTPFDHVLFCPNITSDTARHADSISYNKSESDQTLAPIRNATTWQELCDAAGVEVSADHHVGGKAKVQTFSSIENVKNWVEKVGRDNGAIHTQVFVTGSLHLVGGMLSNLNWETQ